jgi:hypothetical protein
MPAPADIQTTNGGGPQGRPATGDKMIFTFAGALNPTLVLAGWNGAPTAVTLRITGNGKNDVVTVLNAANGAQLALGSVQLGGNYVNNTTANFTRSTMTLSGNVVTVTLGTLSTGKVLDQKKAATMIWTAPSGTANESGPADNDF